MANIVITKSGNSIIVDFGDYDLSPTIDGRKASYKVDDISIIWIDKDDSFVTVRMKDAITIKEWPLTYDNTYSGSDLFIVDTVDGVAPVSNDDLFDKLTALM
jgi:hypothetical protein